jgi:hypothetical protein
LKHPVRRRSQERGQTLLLVVVAMGVLLGMAALAIDIATLYTAHNEARRTADAAALAGAQAFASSSFTSGWLSDTVVCSGSVASPGLTEQRALQVVAQNPVAGAAANLLSTTCTFSEPPRRNPRFTVNVQRSGLPTFFGRIWGGFPGTITASASAEAFNPSGSIGPPIQVGSVKPWAVPNCDPTPGHSSPAGTNCGPGVGSFVNPSSNYAISNPSGGNPIVSKVFDLREATDPIGGSWTQPGSPGPPPVPPTINFLAVDVPISAASVSCPSSSRVSCSGGGLTLDPSNPQYPETIACGNSQQLSCGQTLNLHSGSGSPPSGHSITADQAVLCLTHANTYGINQGQDQFCDNGSSPSCPSTSPINIDAGANNPDPGLLAKDGISRSDSVVTVPVFTPACPDSSCTNTPVTIVGFLQLGIARVRAGSSHPVRVIVMNVSGCGSATSGTPISGGGASPIPVRLVQ